MTDPVVDTLGAHRDSAIVCITHDEPETSGRLAETVPFGEDAYMRLGPTVRLGTTAHELGHAQGLAHVADPDALMYRVGHTNIDAPPPGPSDVAEWYAVRR